MIISINNSLSCFLKTCYFVSPNILCYFVKSCDSMSCHCIDMQQLFAHFQITAFWPLASLCCPVLLCLTMLCLLGTFCRIVLLCDIWCYFVLPCLTFLLPCFAYWILFGTLFYSVIFGVALCYYDMLTTGYFVAHCVTLLYLVLLCDIWCYFVIFGVPL